MFEQFFGNRKEVKQQLASENRQMNFAREQSAFGAGAESEQIDLQTQEAKSDLLRWQQSLNPQLMELINYVKGVKIVNGNIVIIGGALCNDLFITDVIIPYVSPFLQHNMINSNFTELQILNMLRNTCDDIANSMSDGWDKYDIPFEKWDNVVREIKTTITPTPFKAQAGWTKKTDSTVIKRIEAMHENPAMQQPRHKFLGLV